MIQKKILPFLALSSLLYASNITIDQKKAFIDEEIEILTKNKQTILKRIKGISNEIKVAKKEHNKDKIKEIVKNKRKLFLSKNQISKKIDRLNYIKNKNNFLEKYNIPAKHSEIFTQNVKIDTKAEEVKKNKEAEIKKKMEEDKINKLKAEKEAEAQRLEAQRLAKIKAEREAEAKRLEAQRLEAQRLAKIKAEREAELRKIKEETARLKAAKEAEAKRLEAQRLAEIKAAKEAEAKRLEAQRLAKIKAEKEAEIKRLEAQRLAKIKAEKEAEAKRLKKLKAKRIEELKNQYSSRLRNLNNLRNKISDEEDNILEYSGYSGKEIAKELDIEASENTRRGWRYVFSNKYKQKKYGIYNLSEKAKLLLKKYLMKNAKGSQRNREEF